MHYKQIDNSKMIFYYPKKVSSKFSTVGPPLFANVNDELAVKEELYAFNYMYKNLDKIPLYSNTLIKEGELNIKYSPSSVKANFDRDLKKVSPYMMDNLNLPNLSHYVSSLNLKYSQLREFLYKVTVGNKVFFALIKVYPYHNGSKVKYVIWFKYYIYSGGKSSLNQDYITQAINLIKKVAEE